MAEQKYTDPKTYPFVQGTVYNYNGYLMYVDDGCIWIEEKEQGGAEPVDEVPTSLLSNRAVRKAIYQAYVNFGDTWVGTIYRLIASEASFRDLMKIEGELNKFDDSLYNY